MSIEQAVAIAQTPELHSIHLLGEALRRLGGETLNHYYDCAFNIRRIKKELQRRNGGIAEPAPDGETVRPRKITLRDAVAMAKAPRLQPGPALKEASRRLRGEVGCWHYVRRIKLELERRVNERE